MRCAGFTNTTGALRLTRQNLFVENAGDRTDVENIIILITDGNDNRENGTLLEEVRTTARC